MIGIEVAMCAERGQRNDGISKIREALPAFASLKSYHIRPQHSQSHVMQNRATGEKKS